MIKIIILLIVLFIIIKAIIIKNTQYVLLKYENKNKFFALNSDTAEYNLYLEKTVFGKFKTQEIYVKEIPENSIRVHFDHWNKMIETKKPFKR